MVWEAAAADPTPPEPAGLIHRDADAGGPDRRPTIRPAQRDETGLALRKPVAGANGSPLDSQPQVAREDQPDNADVRRRDLVIARPRVLPCRIDPAVVKRRLAVERNIDRAVQAGRMPDQHVRGIEIAGRAPVHGRAVTGAMPRTHRQEVTDRKPAGACLPGRREHHRARHVTTIRRHRRVRRRQPKRARRTVKQRPEHARVVRRGRHSHSTAPVGASRHAFSQSDRSA